jgi:hypothetical protein
MSTGITQYWTQNHGNENKEITILYKKTLQRVMTSQTYMEYSQDAEHNSTNLHFSRDLSIVDKDSNIINLISDSVTDTVSDTESIDSDTLSFSPLSSKLNKQQHHSNIS